VMKNIKINNLEIGNNLPLAIIAGPCQLESLDHALMISEIMAEICVKVGTSFIFKASYDKANRTSAGGKRGVGIDHGLSILSEVRARIGCPVLTDVHDVVQCRVAAQVVDVIQIPAFLCRQTDLLIAAAKTGAVINIKKGQFLAPWDMGNVIKKVESSGNEKILLTERGSSFGYNTLVTDFRGIPIMAKTGYPIIMDATHSVQQPGGNGDSSGGQREFAPIMARAAVSLGIAGVFIETHENPDEAPSDGPNMIPIGEMGALIQELMDFDKLAKKNPCRI
jgi:2-dehydro-3-deoxyphosphooctonate aldolase (KDO 8-P synthase)